MKLADILKIKEISFDFRNEFGGNTFAAVVKVDKKFNTSTEGYNNYICDVTLSKEVGENVRIRKGTNLQRRLLFLESYGDDLPDSLYVKLFGSKTLVICVIDLQTQVFYWGEMSKPSRLEPASLLLTRVGVLHKAGVAHCGQALEVSQIQSHHDLNEKRPYHFEINWWHIERFLEGEEGWHHLREGLTAVVRLEDHTQFRAMYEQPDERPDLP